MQLEVYFYNKYSFVLQNLNLSGSGWWKLVLIERQKYY